jgi:hypothetical protein
MAQATKARPKKSRQKSKSKSHSKPKAKAKTKAKSRSTSSNGVVNKVEQPVKDAGHAVGHAVGKAKMPLVAGGAALAGAAGGLALGARQARHARKRVKVRSQDVTRVAKEVGGFGAQVGRLASELQHAREASKNGGSHRSPVEVVLDGLTSRR